MAKLIYEKKLSSGVFSVYDDKPDLEQLIFTRLTHSADIVIFKDNDLTNQQADGILAMNEYLPNNHFVMKTGDCIPALFLGEKGIVMIHAGWKGVRDNILTHPLIATIEPYYCFLGPSIHQESFEVQEDFYQHFSSDEFYLKKEGKIFYDLQGKAQKQIQETYPQVTIEDSGECTYQNPIYNSYRRDKTSQRNWNIFSIEYNKKEN